jgi:hypothetical protein
MYRMRRTEGRCAPPKPAVHSLNYENDFNNSFVRVRLNGRGMFSFGKTAGQGDSDHAQSEFEI